MTNCDPRELPDADAEIAAIVGDPNAYVAETRRRRREDREVRAMRYERCREPGCCLDELSNGYCYSHAYAALGREASEAFKALIVIGYAMVAAALVFLAVKQWVI